MRRLGSKKYIREPWEERRMNRRYTIMLRSQLHPCDAGSVSALGALASGFLRQGRCR
jgi:hypothetical protein